MSLSQLRTSGRSTDTEIAVCMRVFELEPEPGSVVGTSANVDEENVAKRGEVGEMSGEFCWLIPRDGDGLRV